jgi:hypothetical protein
MVNRIWTGFPVEVQFFPIYRPGFQGQSNKGPDSSETRTGLPFMALKRQNVTI